MGAGTRSRGARKRLGIVLGLVVGGTALALPASASAATTCNFNAGTNLLEIELSANNDRADIMRTAGGDIDVGTPGVIACGGGDAQRVDNVDTIDVDQPGASQSSQVFVNLGAGPFEPGATAEPTGVSEIEFDIDLGDGFDTVHLSPRNDPFSDHFRFGDLPGGASGANLNAPEAGGPDGDDLRMTNVDSLTVTLGFLETVSNTYDGGGGPEFTGSLSALPMGGLGGSLSGPDTIIGGTRGGIYDGFGGDDTLLSSPDSPFSETLRGGDDTDTLEYSRATSGVTVDLGVSAGQDTGGGGFDVLDLTDFENLTGGPFGDTLTGTGGPNRIVGAAGTDTLNLLDGADEFDVMDGAPDTVNCGPGTDTGVADVQGVDTLTDCETVDFPPQTAIDSGPANGATTNDPTPTYGLSADEPATFQHSVDGGAFQDCDQQCEVAILSEAPHTLEFRAVDQDAPSTPDPTPVARTVTIDTTPPGTTIESGPGQGATIADRTPTFEFASEPGASFECAVDVGAFAACASPHTTPALADGVHTFRVRARDQASNRDPSPASRSFRVDTPQAPPPDTPPADTRPPESTITSGPKRKVKTRKKKARATFAFSLDDPDATLECSLDDAPFSPCRSPLSTKVKKGRHSFRVRGTDQAGNVEPEPAIHTWKVKRKKRRR